MTEPTGAPKGRKPQLTAEQDREVYEAVTLRRELTTKRMMQKYGVSGETLRLAVRRELRRRQS